MSEDLKNNNNDDNVDRSSVSRNHPVKDQNQDQNTTTLNPTITPNDDDKYSQLHSQNEWDNKILDLELEQDYVDEEELKRIAESLAPRVTSLLDSNEAALEEMLAKDEELWISSNNYDNYDDYEDNDDEDGDDDGLEELRQELEASQGDWGRTSILMDPCSIGQDTPPHTPLSESTPYNTFDTQIQHEQESSILFPPSRSSFDNSHPSDTHRVMDNSNDDTINNNNNTHTYTIYDHAKYLNLQFDDTDLGYPTCPLVNKQYVQLFLETLDYLDTEGSASEPMHMQQQQLDNQETKYDANTTHALIKTSKSQDEMIQSILLCNKEYIKPMSNDSLSRIYEGISSSQNPWYEQDVKQLRDKKRKNRANISIKDVNGKPLPYGNSEMLPLRTISIQIRPDVLCGAVMDAVYSALYSIDAEVTKRQGGHLRALVPGTWIPEPSYSHFKPFGANQGYGMAQMFGSPTLLPQLMSDGMVFVPPFVVDVQLCMKRSSRTADRILLIRIYPISPGQTLDDGIVCPDTSTDKPLPNTTEHSSLHGISMESDGNNWNLREASSLFQRMRDVAKSGGTLGFSADRRSDDHDYDSNVYSTPKQPKSMIRNVLTSPLRLFSPSKPTNTPKRNKPTLNFVRFDAEQNVIKGVDSARIRVTEKLISQFTVTPSILEDVGDIESIPSLSFVDWPYIQSSWRFIKSCLNELESRNLAYRYVLMTISMMYDSLSQIEFLSYRFTHRFFHP